jgi:hypothetical protein
MVASMNPAVTVDAAAIERKNVKTGDRLMTGEHEHVTLLAHQMALCAEQAGVVRAVSDMTAETVLADRRVLPQEGAAFLSVAAVTDFVRRARHHHVPSLASMRVVTRGALQLRDLLLGSEEMGRSLIESLSDLLMACEAGVRDALGLDHRGTMRMMNAVAGTAAHVLAVMRTASPGAVASILVVALETSARLLLRRHVDVFGFGRPDVLSRFAMARVTARGIGGGQKFHGLPVERRRKPGDHFLVASLASCALSHLQRGPLRVHRRGCPENEDDADQDSRKPSYAKSNLRRVLYHASSRIAGAEVCLLTPQARLILR